MSLKNKTISGVIWGISARLSQDGVGFLTILILARFLSPTAFGLLGMITIFTGILALLQDFGLGSAIIQAKEISQEQLSGIFWFNLMFSILLLLLTFIIAPLISNFYNQPTLTPIIRVLAISFPLSALALTPNALLRKHLMFKKLAIIQNTGTIAGSIVGISTAILGGGIWALVWQQITIHIVNTFLQIIATPWRPMPTFSYNKIKKQLYFGFNLQTSSIFNYGTRNADDLLVGKMIGPEALGTYQMAYRMMLWPLEKVTYVLNQVMFPATATIQGDKERVKRIFLRSASSIALITFPMVLGLWSVIPSVVYILLGEKWAGVIPIFQVLGILGLNQSINANASWILMTQGRADLILKIRVGFFILYLTAFIVGVNWGAIGVAIAYTLTNLLLTPVYYRIIGPVVDMTFFEVLQALAGVFFCALIMAIVVWGIKVLLPATWPYWVYLTIQIPIGIAVYGILLHFFNLKVYREMRQLVYEQMRLRFPMMVFRQS